MGPLSGYALIDMEAVLESMKKANRIRAGEPAESPEDWFHKRLKNG